ncbi:MAG: methyltransferase family protein [Bacteroidetes bacterium]|jgi:ubiquinone/menaquinone biosynthesis C-methylase UbiE|nr:methyltransferase family protein [Bacteroidota bacterium]
MDPHQTTFNTWNKLAKVYQDKMMDLDIYLATYDRFCELVEKPGAGIFEIACGPGNVTRYLLSKRQDFRIYGTDIAPNMVELAKVNNPTARFEVMDCREIDKVKETFDAVFCGFCMPYISKEDCAKLIRDCAGLLNAGGVFYFSTMEGDHSGYETASNGQDQCYMYYHPADFLQQQLKANGFELTELKRQEYKKHDGSMSTDMFFFARKK